MLHIRVGRFYVCVCANLVDLTRERVYTGEEF